MCSLLMRFTISFVLLVHSTHAAPAQEASDSSNHPISIANLNYDYPLTHVSISTIAPISESTLPHSTASVVQLVAPAAQRPLLSDHHSDFEDSIDSASALLEHWSAHDCPSALPSATCYRSHSDFPSISKWLSWDCLVSQNLYTLLTENGPDEVFMIIASLKAVSDAAGIDPRIPFALLMQATSGAVRPPLDPTSPLSKGLFQVQTLKAASCAGTPFNKCAPSIILAMIQDGIFGHHDSLSTAPAAPGIGYWIPAEAGNVPRALRAYSSGKVIDRNDLTQIGRTGKRSFVSDIANWLVGASVGAVRPVTCL